MSDVHVTAEPDERLTILADQITECLKEPENADIAAIILLNDADRHGIKIVGFKDTAEAIAEMMMHLNAVFKAAGKKLTLIDEEGAVILSSEEV